VSLVRSAKRRLNRLGALRQYPPRELKVPARYRAQAVPADAPGIAIATPSRNHGRFIGATIESVLAQGYPALEYVVQDGGSEDDSREILEHYSAYLHHWESAADGGQAQALNAGFARTSGEVMAYLNADDILLPGALAHVAGYLRGHPEVDVVYGHRVVIDENGLEVGRQVIPRHDDEVLSWGDFIPQETMFWRRSIWEAAGGAFDESFECAMDWDLLVRMRDAGAHMVRLPRFLGAFRVHGDQKTLKLGETVGAEEMARIRRRIHGRDMSHREAIRKARPYVLRHVVLDRLYRARLLRY